MKEHVQEPGIRKWAGDDLVELQNEPLSALQTLVYPYSPCILYGCEVSVVEGSTYKLSSGLAAIKGVDAQGIPCVKIVRVPEVAATTLPVYIYLDYETISRVYASNEDKPVAYDYVAKVATTIPEADSYLTITAAGGQRLPDTMGITKKLNSDGGEAKDVKVTFAQASSRTLPASGSKLGILMGSIRKWLYDLKALAFKDKVATSDLDTDVVATFNKKVDKKAGYALSKNDFTDALLDKLNGIAANANNYALPPASSSTRGGIKVGYSESSNSRAVQLSGEKAYVYIPNASSSSPGLMASSDKSKLDGIATGANKYVHPTTAGNKHIPAGGSSNQYLSYSASGTAKWTSFPRGLLGYAALHPTLILRCSLSSSSATSMTIGINIRNETDAQIMPFPSSSNPSYVSSPSTGVKRFRILFTEMPGYGHYAHLPIVGYGKADVYIVSDNKNSGSTTRAIEFDVHTVSGYTGVLQIYWLVMAVDGQ